MKSILNFYQLSDVIYSGGQPDADQFLVFPDNGIRTVINLALTNSDGAIRDEGFLVTGLFMNYVHIPVLFENPKRTDLQRFYKAMELALDEKVFVHCAKNYRASAFLYLYSVNVLHWNPEEAKRDLEQVWTPDPVWKSFLEENEKD